MVLQGWIGPLQLLEVDRVLVSQVNEAVASINTGLASALEGEFEWGEGWGGEE